MLLAACIFLCLTTARGAGLASPAAGRPEPAAPALPPNLDPVRAGQELAAQLRAMLPPESTRYTGRLRTREPDKKLTRTAPVTVTTTITDLTWQVVYETAPGAPLPPERLAITHAPDTPNAYVYGSGTNINQPARLTGEAADRPFAGSVFWLSDLGLEFFHWPRQRLVKYEMRHSRSCRVLESRPGRPNAAGYARVLSWVDVDTAGLVAAEAYDAHNKLLKEFDVRSLLKVEGRYQVKDVRLRDVQTKAVTELEYDPDQP